MKIGAIDVEGLREARDQMWSEAQILYSAGVPWWLTKETMQRDAEQQQRDRYQGDPWDDAIKRYVGNEDEVTIDSVLRFALSLEIGRCGQLEMNRVARVLRALGLVRRQRGSGASDPPRRPAA